MKKERWVICGDQHCPWHDETVHAAFQRFLKKFKPDGFIINGDFLDVYSLSRHLNGAQDLEMADKQMINIEKEITPANDVLDDYDFYLPKDCKKVFLYGNHEDRVRRWAANGNNAVLGGFLSPKRLLSLERRGYQVIEDYPSGYVEIGSLQIAHGSKSSMNASKGILDEYRHSVANNHTHTSQITYVGGIGTKQIGICIGCMCDMNSQGMKYAKNTGRWVHSWLIVTVEGKRFWPELVLGYDKRFFYGGEEI